MSRNVSACRKTKDIENLKKKREEKKRGTDVRFPKGQKPVSHSHLRFREAVLQRFIIFQGSTVLLVLIKKKKNLSNPSHFGFIEVFFFFLAAFTSYCACTLSCLCFGR
jgi:hypothetical protein